MRHIFEADADGDSVVLWEGVYGSRIYCKYPVLAENLANWINSVARQFHAAKQDTGSAGIYIFGDMMTEFEFTERLKRIWRRAGYVVINTQQRTEKEFWGQGK